MGSLADKVAVVTGASRGLGRAMALALAREGAAIFATARDEASLAALAEEVRAGGGTCETLAVDVAAEGAAGRIAGTCVEKLGALDILVNNAGVSGYAPSLEVTEQDWRRTLDINLTAPFLLAQAAAREMVRHGRGGRIVNIASMFGLKGEPGLAAYTATKGGLVQLTRTLAVEWARYNIQVNAIAPGYFETEMTVGSTGDQEIAAAMLRKIPARRFGRAEELGPLVVYLASDASRFMTGETLVIDGGQSAR